MECLCGGVCLPMTDQSSLRLVWICCRCGTVNVKEEEDDRGIDETE